MNKEVTVHLLQQQRSIVIAILNHTALQTALSINGIKPCAERHPATEQEKASQPAQALFKESVPLAGIYLRIMNMLHWNAKSVIQAVVSLISLMTPLQTAGEVQMKELN